MEILDVPYRYRKFAASEGARFDSNLGSWVFRGRSLPESLSQWVVEPHTWRRWQLEAAGGCWTSRKPTAKIELREHQAAVGELIRDAWVAGLPGFLLADEVGLGKTFSAIAGVERLGRNLHVLVLCPLSITDHWLRSLNEFGTSNRWCVTNYERAKSLLREPPSAASAKRQRTKNKRHATQGTSLAEWDIVICDESHRLKNPVAQRTAAVRRLATTAPKKRKLCPDGAFMIWMSATAGQNPLELSYLGPVLAARTGSHVRALKDFESWSQTQGIQVTRGPFGAWQWTRNDADLDRMHELLFTGNPAAGVRRRPEDIAGWPELTRVGFPVQLKRSQRSSYQAVWAEFCREMQLVSAARKAGTRSSLNPLTASLRFRQKSSLLRVETTAQFVSDKVADGFQVAVSCAFLESGDQIAAALHARGISAERVDGTVTGPAREKARVRFQQGLAPVVIFTVTEGISLHAGEQSVGGTAAPRSLVVHDLRWTALELKQIEGRCHRDGQHAVAYHMFAADTVEEKVSEACFARLADMEKMLGDESTGLDALLDAAEEKRACGASRSS